MDKDTQGDMYKPDFSRLLLPDCPLPYDFEVTHAASQTTWKLHYYILTKHDGLETNDKVDQVKKILEKTNLPIHTFLHYLYFSIDADHLTLDCTKLCHCIQLCTLTGIDPSHLLWRLNEHLPVLSSEALIQFTIEMWLANQNESDSNWLQSSSMMSLLVLKCRKYVTSAEIEQALFNYDFSKVSLGVPQLIKLSSTITSFLSPYSSTNLILPHLNASPPKMVLPGFSRHKDSKLVPDLQFGKRTWQNKYSWAFAAQGDTSNVLCVNSLVLYPQWKWFEKLVKSNCLEARTRAVEMPKHLTYQAMQIIFDTIYQSASHKSIQSHSFAEKDLAVIYRFRDELMLSVSFIFADIFKEGLKMLSLPVNRHTCLKMLGLMWDAGLGLSSPLLASALQTTHENRHSLTVAELSILPLPLSLVLCAYDGEKAPNTEKLLECIHSATQLLETMLDEE